MPVHLLDINVLLALAWPTHEHHAAAHQWFAAHSGDGWATCPLTQSGFVRLSSNPVVIPQAVSPAAAILILERMCSQTQHVFWPDDVPLWSSVFPRDIVQGYRQVTDAYLLALCQHHRGALATIDKRLATLARDAKASVSIIAAK